MTDYQRKWKKLREIGNDLYCLRGTQLLLEVMPEQEVTLGDTGIVIAGVENQVHGDTQANSGVIGVILDVGQGYYDAESDSYVPLDLKAGNVVLLPRYSLQYYSKFPGFTEHTRNQIALCLESEVKFFYEDMNSYIKAQEILAE